MNWVGQWITHLRNNSRQRRLMFLGIILTIIIAVTLATVFLVILILSLSSASISDRLAEVGIIIAGATLALAAVAALVALLAYAISTGTPDLKLQVHFEFSSLNRPVFRAEPMDGDRLKAVAFKQTCCTISLRNTSGYSARNPAVIVRLHGMVFLNRNDSLAKEWVVVDFSNTNGIKGVQWDGGPTYSIHGRSVRRLPMLDLVGLTCIPAWGDPAMPLSLF